MNERRVRQELDNLRVLDQDLHLRRIRNASDAVEARDYVTLQQLRQALASIKFEIPRAEKGDPGPPGSGGDNIVDLTGASGTVTPDHSAGTYFDILVTGNFTLAAPSNLTNNKKFALRLLWDSTGGHVVTLNVWYGPLRNMSTTREIEAGPNEAHMFSGIVKSGAFLLMSQDAVSLE